MTARCPHWEVAIIGAGPGGLGLAIQLVKSGRRDFVLFEASDGVGGTWRTNTYPGAACDVPSHLYSYSFALKPDWSKTYANQPEILRYFEDCADRFGIRPHLRTNTRITAAAWDAEARRWRLTDADGGICEADVLVSAIGTFTTPSVPDLEGLATFAGPCFHSARWEHEHDLADRRVAVIGTGASAAQIVPELAKGARSVPSSSARRNGSCLARTSRSRRSRSAASPATASPCGVTARRSTGPTRTTSRSARGEEGPRQLEAIARSHIAYRITDEELRAKLTPDQPFGCKRTLVCSDFYKALLRDNVELVTERIDRVTPGSIVTGDGCERPVDAIVLATGFRATEYLEGIDVVGVDGRRLHDDWSEVAHAYLGLTVSGYPNFFMLYGPNTNQGANSIIVMLEAQAAYVLGALRAMRRHRVHAVDVRRDVMEGYNRELARGAGGHRVERRVPELLQECQREDRHPAAPDLQLVRRAHEALPDAGVCTVMKAAVYYETGAPEVFRYEDVPDPQVGPGDVLIDVEAVSIEGGDTLNRLGGDLARVPHVVGYQAAGTVAAVGADVRGFAVGDRAVTVGLDGSHAERRATPEGFAWKIPDSVSTDDAACVPVPFGTADDCLFEFGHLQAGETALIHAGAGGVGIAAIQMAKRAGARVFATASSDDRLERLKELGLDEGINYVTHDFVAEGRRLTDGRGMDVVVDSVGGVTLQGSINLLAYRGRCVTVGDAGRAAAEHLDISTMRGNNQTLSGYFLGAELLLSPRPHAMIAGHLDAIGRGELKVVIDRTFPLSDAAGAHAYIESRQAFGRVLLVPWISGRHEDRNRRNGSDGLGVRRSPRQGRPRGVGHRHLAGAHRRHRRLRPGRVGGQRQLRRRQPPCRTTSPPMRGPVTSG